MHFKCKLVKIVMSHILFTLIFYTKKPTGSTTGSKKTTVISIIQNNPHQFKREIPGNFFETIRRRVFAYGLINIYQIFSKT